METKEIIVIKNSGKPEVFDPNKLKNSLIKAGASMFVAEDILSKLSAELQNGVSTHDIYQKAHKLLHEREKRPAFTYSLKRSIMNLGPTGFPFEQYISAIFKAKGFHTLTGVMVQGHCVAHEIDVVAYNENKLIMTEVKFHNELGLKSDLKVALYVKARFDDLKGKEYNFNSHKQQITEGMLVTNTKFTERAIEYGACAGVNMIGWNYPHKGSLHDLINETGLHPITSLTTLTPAEKKILIEEKIVCTKDLENQKELLMAIVGNQERFDTVLNEMSHLTFK